MHTPSLTRLLLAASSIALLCACGGNEPAPAEPVVDAAPPEPKIDDGMPKLKCPDEATYTATQTGQGIEQACDIAGIRHGGFRLWHDPTTKAVEGEYDMGQPHGDWTWRYPNGSKKSMGKYRTGKQIGGWMWWHENGNPAEEGDFLDGRKAGIWTLKYPSASVQESGLYHNGGKSGRWVYRRDDGENTIARVETWQNGGLTSTEYFDALGKKVDGPPTPSGSSADK